MDSTKLRGFHALMALCLLCTSMAADAQWKWRDAKGRVQYSDLPPPADTPAKDILQSPFKAPPPSVIASDPAAPQPAAPAASAVDPTLEARRKQAEQAEAAKRKADEAQRAQVMAQNCERARSHMRSLESGRRMARTNAKGEQEIIDDTERARDMEQTRKVMASDCR